MEPRRITVILVGVLLASLAGALVGYAAMRVAALLLPGDLGPGTRTGLLTLIGYGAWAAIALTVSGAWLRWRARTR